MFPINYFPKDHELSFSTLVVVRLYILKYKHSSAHPKDNYN